MIVYLVWQRNGWAGPEWTLENIFSTEESARKHIEVDGPRFYPKNNGFELKMTCKKVREE